VNAVAWAEVAAFLQQPKACPVQTAVPLEVTHACIFDRTGAVVAGYRIPVGQRRSAQAAQVYAVRRYCQHEGQPYAVQSTGTSALDFKVGAFGRAGALIGGIVPMAFPRAAILYRPTHQF
jgi:hypothetical protein